MTDVSRSKAIVYLGPSLGRHRAKAILDADYRPPISRGELPTHYDGTVLIVDGVFHQRLAVSPKEILRLVDNGGRVLGASSMGALRAAELDSHGMQGIGWVYASYKSGRIVADDEVAVAFDPDNVGHCLTVPIVNIRYWLQSLLAKGHISRTLSEDLFAHAQAIFYADRSWKLLDLGWSQMIGREKLDALLSATGGALSDIKGTDALAALEYLARANVQTTRERTPG